MTWTRRQFLVSSAAAAAACALPGFPRPARVLAADPTATGVVLWTDAPATHVTVTGGSPQRLPTTGRIELTGLRPDTAYTYVFHTATARAPVGRFRTAPLRPRPLRIGVAGFGGGAPEVVETEDLDLFVLLGDTLRVPARPSIRRTAVFGTWDNPSGDSLVARAVAHLRDPVPRRGPLARSLVWGDVELAVGDAPRGAPIRIQCASIGIGGRTPPPSPGTLVLAGDLRWTAPDGSNPLADAVRAHPHLRAGWNHLVIEPGPRTRLRFVGADGTTLAQRIVQVA